MTLVAKKAPILAAKNSPTTSASAGHQASHGLATVVGLPPVGPDEPHDAQDQSDQLKEGAERGEHAHPTRSFPQS